MIKLYLKEAYQGTTIQAFTLNKDFFRIKSAFNLNYIIERIKFDIKTKKE